MVYPCAFRKFCDQMIRAIKLSTPTSSLSVELRMLSFCLLEDDIGDPIPKVNALPLCALMLGWTAKAASTYQ
jgi:hypothetical protein